MNTAHTPLSPLLPSSPLTPTPPPHTCSYIGLSADAPRMFEQIVNELQDFEHDERFQPSNVRFFFLLLQGHTTQHSLSRLLCFGFVILLKRDHTALRLLPRR